MSQQPPGGICYRDLSTCSSSEINARAFDRSVGNPAGTMQADALFNGEYAYCTPLFSGLLDSLGTVIPLMACRKSHKSCSKYPERCCKMCDKKM